MFIYPQEWLSIGYKLRPMAGPKYLFLCTAFIAALQIYYMK